MDWYKEVVRNSLVCSRKIAEVKKKGSFVIPLLENIIKFREVKIMNSVLKNEIEKRIRNYLFEQNTSELRSKIVKDIEDYLMSKVSSLSVVCNETNNSPENSKIGKIVLDIYYLENSRSERKHFQCSVLPGSVDFRELTNEKSY